MSESGGHGGGWIVTYSDMITLLMACFIMIITFASKEPEKYGQKKDSLVGGQGGSGAAGLVNPSFDRDSLVWRERPPSTRNGLGQSEMAPLYADPDNPKTTEVLAALQDLKPTSFKDEWVIRLPIDLLFESGDKLSSSGTEILHSIGRHVRRLPFDLLVQVDDAKNLARAVDIAQFLMLQESIHPSRLATGSRSNPESWSTFVYVTFQMRS